MNSFENPEQQLEQRNNQEKLPDARKLTDVEIRAAQIADALSVVRGDYEKERAENITLDDIEKRRKALGAASLEGFADIVGDAVIHETQKGHLYEDLDYIFTSSVHDALTKAELADFHTKLMDLRVETAQKLYNPQGTDTTVHPEKAYREHMQDAPTNERLTEKERVAAIVAELRGRIRSILPEKLVTALSEDDMTFLLDDASRIDESLRAAEKDRQEKIQREVKGQKREVSGETSFSLGYTDPQLETPGAERGQGQHGPQAKDGKKTLMGVTFGGSF